MLTATHVVLNIQALLSLLSLLLLLLFFFDIRCVLLFPKQFKQLYVCVLFYAGLD